MALHKKVLRQTYERGQARLPDPELIRVEWHVNQGKAFKCWKSSRGISGSGRCIDRRHGEQVFGDMVNTFGGVEFLQ